MSQYHPTSFLADYLYYNSGNECQENYHIWSAILGGAIALCRRVYLPFEYFRIYPNLYCTLVGEQGNRKSTAKDILRDLVEEVLTNTKLSAAVTSREAICKYLGSDEAIRAYTDADGTLVEHRPIALILNELKNTISINPQTMIDFLTDIYDRKLYDVSTKGQGNDYVPNPCINILACETPEWIAEKMQQKLISGGFARRMIMVYETSERQRIPFPTIPPGGLEAWDRVKQTLRRLETYAGPLTWTEEARDWYGNWYKSLRTPPSPILRAFYSSIHVQLLKISTILSLADEGSMIIKRPTLEVCASLLSAIEPGMAELGSAIGRNELMGPTRVMIDLVRTHGGRIAEKKLRALTYSLFRPGEFDQTLLHLTGTDQLQRVVLTDNGVPRYFLILPQTGALPASGATTAPPSTPPAGE